FQKQVQAQRFEFSSEELALDRLVHPLLRLKPQPPIPNSLRLNTDKRILILSGPNAGGKTVLLKSLGLACHMARCGLPICAAEGSRAPFFSQISVVVGDAQSVESDLSTFAGHLRQLNEASEETSKPHLVLVDEICGSTDPEEGAALARSLIESFSNKGAFALITSHLSQLKSSWEANSPVLCGSMEFDSRTGRPSYHFLAGVPGDSLALQTASRVGVQNEILQRARELLSPSSRARLAQLDELQLLKEDLKRAQALLEKERLQLHQEKQTLQNRQAELEKSKSSELDKVRQEALKQVDELIALAKTENLFRKQASLVETRQKIIEIVKAPRPSPPAGEASFMPQSLEEFRRDFPSGSRVFVPSLQSDAVIQGETNAKGLVFVLSQSMRLQIHWSELRAPRQMSNPTPQLVRRSGYASVTSLPGDQERELDLRGKNIEEALQNLERELDLCLQNKTDRLRIIHGYGTEALKRAVRHFLSRSEYVKKWNAGSPEQGGDGITWVQLEA
ncbi:MAG: Smr/MutS family protein, partial [Bdellovibrio sp.]